MINICPKCHHDNPDTARSCVECGTQLDTIDEIPVLALLLQVQEANNLITKEVH